MEIPSAGLETDGLFVKGTAQFAAGLEGEAAVTFGELTPKLLEEKQDRLFALYSQLPSDEPETMEHMLRERLDPRFSRVVYDERGEIVGAAFVAVDTQAPEERVYLSALVRDLGKADLKGTGELLVREAARAARNAGFGSMGFKVHGKLPTLQAFYERLGARRIGVVPPLKAGLPERILYELSFAEMDAKAREGIEALNRQSLEFAQGLKESMRVAVVAGAFVSESEPAFAEDAVNSLKTNVTRLSELTGANSGGLITLDYIVVDDGSPIPIRNIVQQVVGSTKSEEAGLGRRYPVAPNVTLTLYTMKEVVEAKGQLSETEQAAIQGVVTTEGGGKDSVKGGAIAWAVTTALEGKADYVVQTDFDSVFDVRQSFNLLRPLIEKEAQMAFGTRLSPAAPTVGRHLPHFYTERDRYYPLLRALISELAGVQDPQAGFKAYDAEFLRRSGLFSKVRDRFLTFDSEVILLGVRAGAAIRNVPVSLELPEAGPPTTMPDSGNRKAYIERFLFGREGKDEGVVHQLVRHQGLTPDGLAVVYDHIATFLDESLGVGPSVSKEAFLQRMSAAGLEGTEAVVEQLARSARGRTGVLVVGPEATYRAGLEAWVRSGQVPKEFAWRLFFFAVGVQAAEELKKANPAVHVIPDEDLVLLAIALMEMEEADRVNVLGSLLLAGQLQQMLPMMVNHLEEATAKLILAALGVPIPVLDKMTPEALRAIFAQLQAA